MRTSESNSRNKYVWKLFGVPFVVSIAVCGLAILTSHFRLGAASPGVVALAKSSLIYWTPLLMLIFFVVPVIRSLLAVRKVSAKARVHGMSWYQYLDLSPEERQSLDDIQSASHKS